MVASNDKSNKIAKPKKEVKGEKRETAKLNQVEQQENSQ
jgi:hypothetical protein